MDMKLIQIPLDTICVGCLSMDRSLAVVSNDDLRNFYSSIIQPLNHVKHPLALCWECIAIIKKAVKYRRQAQNANQHLVKYMLHQSSDLPNLSQLSIHTNTHTSTLHISHSTTTATIKNGCESQLKTKDENSLVFINNDNVETNPVAFIKVEDERFDNEEHFGNDVPELDRGQTVNFERNLDGFFVDENNGDGSVDDKDLKVLLKSDPFQYEVTKTKRKSRKTKRRTKEEFDESDEEPLKKKTKEKQEDGKKGGKRKKKDKSESANDKKRARREKPPGVVTSARVSRSLQQLNVPPGYLEMVLLSWQQVEEERQKALKSESFTRHEYRCHDCALGFNHRAKLHNHMRKHDPSAGELLCEVCKVRCPSAHSLSAHKRRHRVRWRCLKCGELASRAAIIADHCSRQHGGPAPTHSCQLCDHRAPSLSKLRHHMKSHSERQRCELCGKTFQDRNSLNTHLFIHKGEKEHECPQCGKRFLFKKAMEIHMVTHDAPSHLYCHQCDVTFKNQMSYYQHMKYNLKHIDPARLKYACGVCGKKFLKASRLDEHNIAVHLKATPVSCTMPGCQFACASRPVLRAHIRLVHRNQRLARNHVCHTCGKAYTVRDTRVTYRHTHTHTAVLYVTCDTHYWVPARTEGAHPARAPQPAARQEPRVPHVRQGVHGT